MDVDYLVVVNPGLQILPWNIHNIGLFWQFPALGELGGHIVAASLKQPEMEPGVTVSCNLLSICCRTGFSYKVADNAYSSFIIYG